MTFTLIIIKPDAVDRHLIGEILGRFERAGLNIIDMKSGSDFNKEWEQLYSDHKDQPFYERNLRFVTDGGCVPIVLYYDGDAVMKVRNMIGATDPNVAAPGTIRGDFGGKLPKNLVHASDSYMNAEREIRIFFPDN